MHLQELLYYNSSKDYVKGKLCYYFNILSQAILPPYRAILDNIYREHFNEPGFDRVAQLNFPFHERVFETDAETGEESGSGRVNLETAEDQRLAAEEYVASIAESGAPKPNWWKEFLQSVRMWIADRFPHARQVRMTDREIETLLARSARAARRNRRGEGKVIAPESMIRFRVNENGETVFGIAGRDGDFTAREIMEDKTISENTPILTSDGSEVWGEITPEMAEAGKEFGLEALPIKLLKGKHFGNHTGFGIEHLWNQHGAELEARGYDLSDFLTRIFGKPNQIYASRQGDNIRLELVTKSKPRNVGVLELRKEDGFYSVVTAFPIDQINYKLKGKLVWRYTASKPNKISQEGSPVISAGKQRTSPIEPLSADNAADAARDTRTKPDINITSSGEKSSGNTGAVYSVDSVWTGSAASYDAPSLQYIGTGEGQQVFGWGLYGSSSREVAEWYAKADVARKRNPAQNDLVVYLDGKKLNDPNSDKDVSDLVWFVFHFGETYVREFAEQNAKLSYSGLEEYSRMRDANPEMRNEPGKSQERDEKTLELLDRIKIEENEDPLIWNAVSGLSSARMKPSERHSAADIEQRLRSDLRNALERRRKSYQELASKNKSVHIREINQRKADAYERAIAKLPSLSREELTTGGLPHNLYRQTFWPGKEENLLDWDKKVPKKQIQKIADQAVKEGLPFGYTENGKNFFNGTATSGELLYHELVKPFNLGSPKAASEFLYRAGIDGVTYIGDSSRVRNYVAFSDQDIHVDEHLRFAISEFSADEESDIIALLRPFVGVYMSKSDAEIVDYLRRHGVELSEEEAHAFHKLASDENRAEARRRSAKQRNEWLYENVPVWQQTVDAVGSENFKIVPSMRFRDEEMSGTFIARKKESGMNSDELAQTIARKTGRDPLEVEQEIMDFFRDLKKPDLYRLYSDWKKQSALGDREKKQAAVSSTTTCPSRNSILAGHFKRYNPRSETRF